MTGNTDTCTTVSDTRAEGADVGGLVTTAQAQLVVLAVDGDVLVVLFGELLDGGLDSLDTALLPHRLGGVVGVAAGTVPVTGQGLGVEGHLDVELFGDAGEEESGHPEMVSHVDTLAWADLELPLGRHDFGVDTADVHAGVEAGTVVGLDEITSEDLSGTYRIEADVLVLCST